MKRNVFVDKLSTTKIKDLGVSLTTYYCGNKVAYKFYVDGKLLFQGDDFKPGALYNWDDLETNLSLMGFLTVSEGATDAEYFKDYTPEQILWRDSNKCQELNILISDLEDKNGEYYSEAIKRVKHKTF